MSEQTLLMPPKADAEAFDLDAHLASLKAQPKEVYQEAITPPTPEPEPAKPGPEPEPEPEKKAESTADDGASARFIIEIYDSLTGKLCAAIVDEPKRYPAEHFQMEPLFRKQAERQLAKGMAESGGKWNIPWYWALAAVLSFSGLMQWYSVKSARKEKKERQEREEREAMARQQAEQAKRTPGQAIAPTTITRANGEQVATPTAPAAPINFGNCAECGKPLEKKGKKYCSQSCAGHARKGKAAKKTTTR